MRALLLLIVCLAGGCAVFNPNHVNLNPFAAPNPCSPLILAPLWNGEIDDLATQDADEAFAARISEDRTRKCYQYRISHPGGPHG